MATLHQGNRIGRTVQIQFGCSAQAFDSSGTQVLLTRRSDNGRWCLPGGRLDPGESVAEACVCEMLDRLAAQLMAFIR